MGIDEGFDMVPPLSKGAADRETYAKFIAAVKARYTNDPQVEIKPNYILFKAGEQPKLPLEGHKLLRFSSKVSGSTATSTGMQEYINTVQGFASLYFGSRVQHWNDGVEVYGTYSWDEVDDSIETYEQVY